MKRYLFIAPFAALSACHTTQPWDQGFPDAGDAVAPFELEEITHDYVVAHGRRFSRESFAPLVKHAVPEVSQALAAADARHDDLALVQAGWLTIVTYAVPEDWPAYVERLRDLAVVGAYGAYFLVDHFVHEDYKEATRQYNDAIRRRLGATK